MVKTKPRQWVLSDWLRFITNGDFQMNIGVVGLGIVGSSVKVGFEELGNDVFGHDLTLDTNLRDVLDTDICYICVPTPPSENGSCDVSIVESVVRDLSALNYNGLVIIKSTVEPGTTERLSSKYKNLQVGFVPEFLRERCAILRFYRKSRRLYNRSGYKKTI